MESSQFQSVTYTFGPFNLIPDEVLLLRDGKPVPLAPKVWETLLALVSNHGRLVTKDDLLKWVWPETFVEEGSLTRSISQLRKVLESEGSGQEYIQTVPTKGYRFVAEVIVAETAAGRATPAVSKLARGGPVPVERQPALAPSGGAPPPVTLGTGLAALPVPRTVGGPLSVPAAPAPDAAFARDRALAPGPRHQIWARRWVAVEIAVVLAAAVVYWLTRPVPELKVTSFRQLTDDGRGKLNAFRGGVPGALLTDGSRLYFTELSGSTFEPAQVGLSGGETLVMQLPSVLSDPVVLEMYPDGTRFLVSVLHRIEPENPFWTLSVPDLTPRPLGELRGHDGTWSPDGQSFVYARGHALYESTAEGALPRRLVSLSGAAWWPRFSPDGRRLRFTVEDETSQSLSLWEVSADGSNLHPLLPGWNKPSAECCGSWTPDGKFYVFQATKDGSTELWSLDNRRSLFRRRQSPVRLTAGPMNFWSPVPGRDGRTIYAVGEQRRGELARYDAATDQFSPYLSGISADHVEFSRDLQWIAYAAYPEGAIWRSRPGGSDRIELSFPPLQALFPRWSPDGGEIAFMGFEPGGPLRIYLVSASGGTPQPMLQAEGIQVDPNWSPDGKRIMFGAIQPAGRGATEASSDIRIFDLRSRQVSMLPGSEGLTAPRWSPDGRYVAVGRLQPGTGEAAVLLYDFSTGKWSAFERDPIDNKWWSRDGKYFYFDKFPETDPAVFRLRLSDRRIEKIVSLKSVPRAWGSLGWWMGLSPDDAPLVLRDTSIQEVYALSLQASAKSKTSAAR